MSKKIGVALAQIRKRQKISQEQLLSQLASMGTIVNPNTLSRWENGASEPRADQFLHMCKILNVKDIYAEVLNEPIFTGKGKDPLSGLNTDGQRKAREYITLLRESGRYSVVGNAIQLDMVPRTLPLYDIAASAGTGQFLDSDHYEMIEVSDDVPASATFGVRIAGDSMEPRFINGQVVWVHQQLELEDGQIGIFLFNGDVYCKKYYAEDGELSLVSLNKNYSPIEVTSMDELRIFGRVVG